ncbi:hypothetical protein Apa02nite_075690 [Actinoplanes palleronii]|uniref:Uncharacterized protein n=1 Tax=Actinoplanes palleronii TaxID=113570 RepID=A0ABQ4BLA5_9ACTN|nr:hypothetical protein Apa02nite_075690 [Actinoplanes palleronii]
MLPGAGRAFQFRLTRNSPACFVSETVGAALVKLTFESETAPGETAGEEAGALGRFV